MQTTHQAELFAPIEQRTHGELEREETLALARSEAVKAEVLAVYRAHPGEWLWFNSEIQRIKDKYDLGFDFNRTIDALHAEGKIESRKVYHGAESPIGAVSDLAGRKKLKKGEKAQLPYLGYSVEFRARAEA